MILRARHLLCVLGNVSSWYSKESHNTLQNQVKSLIKYPHGIIQLTSQCDIICNMCQHCILNHCQERDNSIKTYEEIDMYILQNCNIEKNIQYRISEIIRRVSYNLQSKDIQYICQYCPFKEKCLLYHSFMLFKSKKYR